MVAMKNMLAVLVTATVATSLRVPNNRTAMDAAAQRHTLALPPKTTVPSEAAIKQQRSKIERLAFGLQAVLDSHSAFARSKIAPGLKVFATKLHAVLKETDRMSDRLLAMRKLLAAQEGMATLTGELTSRQEELMKEDVQQNENLLLGVLMTRQREPMAKQLELLKSDDFASLPVSKALLAEHDGKTPLFAQAGEYLDKHTTKGVKVSLKEGAATEAKLEAMARRLKKGADSLQKSYDARKKRHNERMKKLSDAEKSSKSKKTTAIMHSILKREERSYKKWAAMQKHDIDSMKAAVVAVKSGNMKALQRARSALEQSMKAFKDKNKGFLVFLSLGHRMMGRDCSLCAAQCLDNCHQGGKSHVQCMGDCANAGKGN